MNEELIKAYKDINRASDVVGDVMAGIYSGDEHDEAMDLLLLAIDKGCRIFGIPKNWCI